MCPLLANTVAEAGAEKCSSVHQKWCQGNQRALESDYSRSQSQFDQIIWFPVPFSLVLQEEVLIEFKWKFFIWKWRIQNVWSGSAERILSGVASQDLWEFLSTFWWFSIRYYFAFTMKTLSHIFPACLVIYSPQVGSTSTSYAEKEAKGWAYILWV